MWNSEWVSTSLPPLFLPSSHQQSLDGPDLENQSVERCLCGVCTCVHLCHQVWHKSTWVERVCMWAHKNPHGVHVWACVHVHSYTLQGVFLSRAPRLQTAIQSQSALITMNALERKTQRSTGSQHSHSTAGKELPRAFLWKPSVQTLNEFTSFPSLSNIGM
jgi:hypothetical protein